jgi:hypothetical protein
VGVKKIFVRGIGAVSPAGWGVEVLCNAMRENASLSTVPVTRPGWDEPFQTRPVPSPPVRPSFLAHPRLRRSSALTQHILAAANEALGKDLERVQQGSLRLGIVICLMPGCVAYSRRFCEEVIKDPAGASPLIFPETVFNAPASHLAAYLNSTAVTYSIVGDEGTFLQGLALGAGWLLNDQVDACLVIGAEELDWIVADAARLFQRDIVQSAGSGALYLSRERSSVSPELACITDAFSFTGNQSRSAAARRARAQLPPFAQRELLCMGTQGFEKMDEDELCAWADWQGDRFAPRKALGDAFTASVAWQCVTACEALQRGDYEAANVSIVGANQQAIFARFQKSV